MALPKNLIEGHRRFLRDRHAPERGRYIQLAELGQAPTAMVIACCDARVDVSNVFDADHAKPLPVGRRPRGAARIGRYAVDGGRTIVRDGEAVVRLERVDLGNERYALSPYETDTLTQRIVRLLNKYGTR